MQFVPLLALQKDTRRYPESKGTFGLSSHNEDCSILGCMLESPCVGKLLHGVKDKTIVKGPHSRSKKPNTPKPYTLNPYEGRSKGEGFTSLLHVSFGQRILVEP